MQRPNSMFLKGHGNKADFVGFLQKLVPHRSLTLPFELFWFWLRIRGNIRNRKRLPNSTTRRVGELGSWRLSDSASREVADTPIWRVGESTTPRLAESESRLLNVKRQLGESESRRLPDSASRGAALVSQGVAIQIFKNLSSIFRTLNCIYRQSCRLPRLAESGVVFRLRISPRIRSQNRNGSKRSVSDLCRTILCKNPRKFASLQCPLKVHKNKNFRLRLERKTLKTYVCPNYV